MLTILFGLTIHKSVHKEYYLTPNIPYYVSHHRTMVFGLETTNPESTIVRVNGVANVKPFLDVFVAHGHTEVDTARAYCGGDSEKVPMVQGLCSCSCSCSARLTASHALKL